MPQQPTSLFDGSIAPSRRAQKFINNDVTAAGPARTHNQTFSNQIKAETKKPSLDSTRTRTQKSTVLNRQVFIQPKPETIRAAKNKKQKQNSKPRPKYSHTQYALAGMATVVLVVGLSVSILSFQTNRHIQAQVKAATTNSANPEEGTSDVPSETKPSNISAYQVAPSLPKFLKIPSLGISARVKALGVNSNNELLAPSNIYDTGWYNASAKPGDSEAKGAILIDGHVHGPTYPGVFSKIKSLKAGDELQIQRGDNQLFRYQVVKVQNYDANTLDMRLAMASITPGKAGLNLITCGGKYDKKTGYSQRTLVFAVQK